MLITAGCAHQIPCGLPLYPDATFEGGSSANYCALDRGMMSPRALKDRSLLQRTYSCLRSDSHHIPRICHGTSQDNEWLWSRRSRPCPLAMNFRASAPPSMYRHNDQSRVHTWSCGDRLAQDGFVLLWRSRRSEQRYAFALPELHAHGRRIYKVNCENPA